MQRFLLSLVHYVWSFRHAPGLTRVLIGASAAFVILAVFLVRAPGAFPSGKTFVVREHVTVSAIADDLKDAHAIHSTLLFKLLVRVLNPKSGVLSGTYYFDSPINLFRLSYRLSRGTYGLQAVVFTVPEGNNINQIAALALKTFPNFDTKEFIALAKEKEGYLFPDTYHFLPTVSPKEMIEVMESTFQKKIATLQEDIQRFGQPLGDVVNMASYLEEEARLTQTRRIIAGILWKRLSLGMPLQIDSAFAYVNGKNTYQLTTDDLQIDSPYNTYKYRGFTPTPISNPGIDSLLAAVTPIKSKYFFFLSDKEGNMHYAVTHEEHIANKQRYLR